MRVLCQIKGRVQGVGFRFWTRQAAQALGLAGWVKNEPDGSVSALFDGAAESVAAMLEKCRQGPSASQVNEVVSADADGAPEPVDPFEIVR